MRWSATRCWTNFRSQSCERLSNSPNVAVQNPVHAGLRSALLDQGPFLLALRRRLPAIVGMIHWFYSAVPLLEGVDASSTAFAFTRRACHGRPRLASEVSRFSCMEFPDVNGSATTQG